MAAASKLIPVVGTLAYSASVFAQQASESLPLGVPQQGGGADTLGGPGSITTTIASLMAVVGLIVLLAAIYKWLSGKAGGLAGQIGAAGKSPSGLVSVLARYPLGRGQTLILLKVDRRVLLLCQSASGRVRSSSSLEDGTRTSFAGVTTRTLSEITDAEEVASIIAKAEGTGGFDNVLHGYESMDEQSEDMRDVEVVDLTRKRGNLLGSIMGRRPA